jgi:hypothetical protein
MNEAKIPLIDKDRHDRKINFNTIFAGRLIEAVQINNENREMINRKNPSFFSIQKDRDKTLRMFIQDPYDYDDDKLTWPNLKFLEKAKMLDIDEEMVDFSKELQSEFHKRFEKPVLLTTTQSVTQPYIFHLRNKETYNLSDNSLSVLYNRNDLVMKITPLFTKYYSKMVDETLVYDFDQHNLDEIFNDITICYFLNELLYGYKHVLCVHFVLMIDWFPMIRTGLVVDADILKPKESRRLTHQVTIMEKADIPLETFITHAPSLAKIRMVLFQTFNALEVAYYTNRFHHNDLHYGNVMIQNIIDTSLSNHSFLYKRYKTMEPTSAVWYKIPKDEIGNYMVKLIDFGKSSLNAPNTKNHLMSAKNKDDTNIHVHSTKIFLKNSSPKHDINCFLLNIIVIVDKLRDKLKLSTEELDTFYAFCDDILPLEEVNMIVDNNEKMRHELMKHTASDRVTSKNILKAFDDTKMPNVFLLVNSLVFRRPNPINDEIFKKTLNHSFFEGYEMKGVTLKDNKVRFENSIVVSFPTSPDEMIMYDKIPKGQKKKHMFNSNISKDEELSLCSICDVCGQNSYDLYSFQKGEKLCSKICYEFKYFCNERTAFR